MARKKLVHKPLHCPICGLRFMNLFGQPLPNHAQIRVQTLTGDEMDLGVCAKCIDAGVTLETCQSVLDGIKDYWSNEIDANKLLKKAERDERKAVHNSHKIATIIKVVATGKRAEAEARKVGKLR